MSVVEDLASDLAERMLAVLVARRSSRVVRLTIEPAFDDGHAGRRNLFGRAHPMVEAREAVADGGTDGRKRRNGLHDA